MLNITLVHIMHVVVSKPDYLYNTDEIVLYQYAIRAPLALALSLIPALLGHLPKSMTHRRLSDLLFKSSRSARRSFFICKTIQWVNISQLKCT